MGRLPKTLSALFIFAVSGWATVNVPLTIQETIYPGSTPGVNRTQDPVSIGVPLPDDPATGVSDVNQLALTGTDVAQFRVLARWPSGRIKWVLVDTRASLSAGGTTSITLVSGGNGNFGGSNLATDNGPAITVATGAATFTIRKANFNGFDAVSVGSTAIVSSGASQGFVVLGPSPTAAYPGNVTCSPTTGGTDCTTVYSSANDPNSTCTIEENGPAKAVVKCTFNHVASTSHVYMRGTARMYFFKGKTFVQTTSILHNADYGASNTFATAYKGHRGYELRIAPALTGTLNYTFAKHAGAGNETGTISGADSVYLYQAQSRLLKVLNWCEAAGCVPISADRGYTLVKTASATPTPATLASGTQYEYPVGWADLSNAAGAGIQIGSYQLAATEMKSLEFNSGGADVRIGLWARQNSQPYYQTWPQWSINRAYVNFHASSVASPNDEFLKSQHYLVGRAPFSHYNNSGVFPYKLVDPAVEDAWYRNAVSKANPATIPMGNACCIGDRGSNGSGYDMGIYPWWAWANGGADTQTEYRWSDLLNFITRGHTGRYLNAAHFYQMQADRSFPHSDSFDWRFKAGELDSFGQPRTTSANSTKAGRNWHDGGEDPEHFHWYGMGDFYFMSGDETIRDGMLDGAKDFFANSNTIQARGNLWNSRSNGTYLIGAARFGQFLRDIGDTDADLVLSNGVSNYNATIKAELCLSGYPTGCNVSGSQGTSRTRGARWGKSGEISDTWCGIARQWRMTASFQSSIAIQGILELRAAKGPGWSDYVESLDLAYGISRWLLSEMFKNSGDGRWDQSGFYYYMAIDGPNACTGPGESPEGYFIFGGRQTVSMAFLPTQLVDGGTEWGNLFTLNWQSLLKYVGTGASDHSSYQPAHLIGILTQPAGPVLQTVPLTSVNDNGGGVYTLSWQVPTDARSYRIKWAPKRIVDWLNFNALTNTFGIDPATATPWFAANNAAAIPVPSSAGSVQTITINTGVSGLNAQNFSVKAYVGSSGVTPGPGPGPGPTASLAIVSGNGQSGTVGQPLANPFTVRLSDTSGNPVAGVTVAFSVTSGSGTLSPLQSITDSQGRASSTLTLGAVAGTVTVTASAGTSYGSPVVFTATGVTGSPSLINWRKSTVTGLPKAAQWQLIHYEPVGQTTVIYQSTNDSIYSNGIWHFKGANESVTLLGTSGSTSQDCPPDTDSWPGDRHPMGQMAVDTRRNVMWLAGGICGGETRADTYQLRLNANPSLNSWRRLQPTRFPWDTRFNSMIYDPDTDILFTYGYDGGADTQNAFVYCPTDLNPTPGTLTSAQTSAGCVQPDTWNEVTVNVLRAGKTTPCQPAFTCKSPWSRYPAMVYDSRMKKVVMVGGYPAGSPVETWVYDVPTRTFTELTPFSPPPVPSEDLHRQVALTYNPSDGLMYFHDSTGPSDWTYNLQTNTWTRLGNFGGPRAAETITYDASLNALIAWSINWDSGSSEVWIGQLSGSSQPVGTVVSCDLNSDGKTTVLDVQVGVQQAVGNSGCGTADLNHDGRCDDRDVQILIGAALGRACAQMP